MSDVPQEIYNVIQDIARVEDMVAIADRLGATSFAATQSDGYAIVYSVQKALRQLEREAIRRLRELTKGAA